LHYYRSWIKSVYNKCQPSRHQNFSGPIHIVSNDISLSTLHNYLVGKTETLFSITDLHSSAAIQKRIFLSLNWSSIYFSYMPISIISLLLLYFQFLWHNVVRLDLKHLKFCHGLIKWPVCKYSEPLTHELNSFPRAGRNSSWS
jgi:hypothetical protein